MSGTRIARVAIFLVVALVAALGAGAARADDTLFRRWDDNAPWYFGGQLNVIGQMQGGFLAPYSGPKSLSNRSVSAATSVATLQMGFIPRAAPT